MSGMQDVDASKKLCPSRDLPVGRWELGLVALAVIIALCLGLANIGAPSLWHDELVQVFVAKSIADNFQPALPSGNLQVSGSIFSFVQAPFVSLLGDSEAVVRFPAVVFGALSVVVAFFLVRKLLGRETALVFAFLLATSPWQVAWSREARFCTLQELLYLCFLWAAWCVCESDSLKSTLRACLMACLSYLAAVITLFHSTLFLGPIGLYVFLVGLKEHRLKSRWVYICCAIGVTGISTLAVYKFSLPALDQEAIFDRSGLGGSMFDANRAKRMFYLIWLYQNLSTGLFIAALLGTAAMLVKEKRRGLYISLAFWVPLLVSTFLIGYRRPRFIFYAYPFYVALHSYGLVFLVKLVLASLRQDQPFLRKAVSIVVLAFLAVTGWSIISLCGDSIVTAKGADITLARRHPQWRGPCEYVRENLDDDTAVLTTTYLAGLYYVGRVDNWYPTLGVFWESGESGLEGLKTIEDLQAFMKVHPKGYFIAEWKRFGRWYKGALADQVKWVNDNLTLVEEASNKDVFVYSW